MTTQRKPAVKKAAKTGKKPGKKLARKPNGAKKVTTSPPPLA